jgi:hypothetical protein
MGTSITARKRKIKIIEISPIDQYVALASEPIASNSSVHKGARLNSTSYFEKKRMFRRIKRQLELTSL